MPAFNNPALRNQPYHPKADFSGRSYEHCYVYRPESVADCAEWLLSNSYDPAAEVYEWIDREIALALLHEVAVKIFPVIKASR